MSALTDAQAALVSLQEAEKRLQLVISALQAAPTTTTTTATASGLPLLMGVFGG